MEVTEAEAGDPIAVGEVMMALARMLVAEVMKGGWVLNIQLSLSILRGLVPGAPTDTRICRCSSPLYRMAGVVQ